MKFVLDLNASNTPALCEFLKNGNEIILADDYFVESFKSVTGIPRINRNVSLLKKYPNQIIATYSTPEIFHIERDLGTPLHPNQLISSKRTETIRHLLKLDDASFLRELLPVNSASAYWIEYHKDFAETHILEIASQISSACRRENTLTEYKKDGIKRLRDIQEASFQALELMLAKEYPGKNILNIYKNQMSVAFAYIFVQIWRSVFWALNGNYNNSTKKIQNDSYDLNYVLIACFFDGLLTQEKWLIQCREDALSTFSTKPY